MTVEKTREGNDSYDNFPVGLRVLAVDDNPICLKLLETLLMKCQYHVTTTSQARMALKMLRENKDRFDLVISDVHMPDMDGFRLLEHVGLEMDLPVIMLSANSDPKQVMKGITHGACDYLVKPVRIEELRNIWQHVIRKKKVEPKNENKSADKSQGNQASGDGNGSPTDQNGRFNRKRKDEDDVSEDNGNESEDPSQQKKPRVVWSIELHRKFVAAVNQLGIDKAVPKRILDLMNVEGLTRENVASHLQKYRLYLKRISSVAAQQASMVASLGVKDSPFMRMGPFDGFTDFQSLAGSARLGNVALSPYAAGGMLARLNSPNVNLQNLSNPIPALGQMHPVLPTANQNPSLFQGIPSSLELDQLQQNKCVTSFNSLDDSRMQNASNKFTNPGAAIGVSSNMLNSNPSNPMLLHGAYQQTFRNQSSHNMASLNSESFDVGSTLLSSQTMESSRIQRESSFLNAPYLQKNTLDISSSNMALPLEDSRERQCQEGFVGDVQSITTHSQSERWGEQGQNYGQSSRIGMGSSVLPHLSQNFDQDSGIFNEKMSNFVNGRFAGGASTLMQQNKNAKMVTESRAMTNDSFLLEQQPKLQSGFSARNYDSLDAMMNSMIKREPDDIIPNCDFAFDDYAFGQGI